MAELPDQAEGIGGLLGMPATGRKPFTAYTMRKIRRIMDDTMKITYLLAVQFYCFPFQGDAGSFGQAEAQNQWYGRTRIVSDQRYRDKEFMSLSYSQQLLGILKGMPK